MKRFNFFLLLFLGFGSFLMAQELPVEPVPIHITPIDCKKSANTPAQRIDNCTSRINGKTEQEALAHIFAELMIKLSGACNSSGCKPAGTCKLSKYKFSTDKLTTSHTADDWCFAGTTVINWTCSRCRTKAPDPNNQYNYSFSEIESPLDNHTEASLHHIFPNPSTGLVNLEVTTAKDQGEVVIKVFDLTGKIVHQEIFQADPDAKFMAQMDLSELDRGVYLISTFVDEQLIGTSKVSVEE